MKFKTIGYQISSEVIKQTNDSSSVVWFLDAVQICDTLPGLHLDNITSGTKEYCEEMKASLVASMVAA
jgi:hypothetical protein